MAACTVVASADTRACAEARAETWTRGQRAGLRAVSEAAEIKRAPDGKSGALFVRSAHAEIFNTRLPGRDSNAQSGAVLLCCA